jgi:predicted alpha/beta-hydrolase family hydrolase
VRAVTPLPLLVDHPRSIEPPRHHVLLAHGSSEPMDSPLLEGLAAALSRRGVEVFRFEFPYMASRRFTATDPPVDPLPVLEASFRDAITATGVAPTKLVVAGKSLGGYVATQLADEVRARALVVYGFPFHPPGRPDALRTNSLRLLRTPCLILQGERDPLGRPDRDYGLGPGTRVAPVPGADHGFEDAMGTRESLLANIERLADLTAGFLDTVGDRPRSGQRRHGVTSTTPADPV